MHPAAQGLDDIRFDLEKIPRQDENALGKRLECGEDAPQRSQALRAIPYPAPCSVEHDGVANPGEDDPGTEDMSQRPDRTIDQPLVGRAVSGQRTLQLGILGATRAQ